MFTSVDNAREHLHARRPTPTGGAGQPKLDKITFTVIDQETQAQSFANDEIDAVEVQTPDAYLAAQEKAGLDRAAFGGLTYSQVTFNGTRRSPR